MSKVLSSSFVLVLQQNVLVRNSQSSDFSIYFSITAIFGFVQRAVIQGGNFFINISKGYFKTPGGGGGGVRDLFTEGAEITYPRGVLK